MPDRDTLERFAHRAALNRVVPTQRASKGGILNPENYRNLIVNIRPPRWDDKNKFWVGRIPDLKRAQQIADAIYFYIGKEAFHIKDAVNLYPPITCMGRVPDTPEVLSTPEMFRSYTSAIAKNDTFKPHRADFIAQVEKVFAMPGFPNFPAPPEDDVEHDEGEDIPELEYDEDTAIALSMSSNGVAAPVRPESVSFAPEFSSLSDVDSVLGFLPSFDVQPGDSTSILRSEGQSIGSISLPESMDECPAFQDDEGGQEWFQTIDDLNHSNAAVPTVDAEAYQAFLELASPILMLPPSVNLSASSTRESLFASSTPEEHDDTTPGTPEDSQRGHFKKRRIQGQSK